jgi:hypothetical protein
VHKCTHAYISWPAYIRYIHTHIYIYTYVHTYIHTLHTYIHIHTYTYINTYIYIHIHTYIHKHTPHTHTHTHTHASARLSPTTHDGTCQMNVTALPQVCIYVKPFCVHNVAYISPKITSYLSSCPPSKAP